MHSYTLLVSRIKDWALELSKHHYFWSNVHFYSWEEVSHSQISEKRENHELRASLLAICSR